MIVHDIRVTTSQLLDFSMQIRNLNERLYDDLQQIEHRFQQTEPMWDSMAGNAIRLSMFQLSNRFFEQYRSIVNSYAEFLEQAASQYEITENTIQANASEFM